MVNRQLIVNKVNPEEITVEVRVVDENNGWFYANRFLLLKKYI